jgi:hypothetical protein
MFSVITNIYNKKTKGPTLMELFTVTGTLKKFFGQLEMFDLCTTGDMANIDTIFTFLPHTIIDLCATGETSLVVKKTLLQFSCGCEKFH